MGPLQGLAAGLGVLARLAEPTGDEEGDRLLGGDREFAAESPAHVRGDDAQLAFGDPEGHREHEFEDVGDLRGRPHSDLLTGGVHDGRAGLHERRNEALLAEGPLDDDVGIRQGFLHVAARAGFGGVEHPRRGNVRAEFLVDQLLIASSGLQVEHDWEVLVLDVDEFLRIACLGCRAGGDDGNDIAGEGDLIDRYRRARWRFLIRGDGPGVRQTSLDIGGSAR